MASLFWRGAKRGWCIQAIGNDGKLRQRSAGKNRAQAMRLLAEVEAGLREEKEHEKGGLPAETEALFKDVAGPWLEERRKRGLRNGRTEESYVRCQILPRLGDKVVGKTSREDVRRAVWDMQAKGMAPRSVRHAYGIIRVLFADLVASNVIHSSPCTLTRRELPKLLDKDPSWRSGAVFTREEVEILISSEAVPEDRKTLYALLFLTGARVGEAAGLRWRDLDEKVEPLHRLMISRSYDGPTKTGGAREVPVHPTLAAVLAEWRLGGFARLMGRPPRPDDLIVPSRRTIMRTRPHVYHRWQEDLDRLGLRRRRVHDTRRTYITLARVDGASKDVLEHITHRGLGGILDVYTTLPWKTLCDAVSCLKIQRLGAEVVRLRLVANAREKEVAEGGLDNGTPGGEAGSDGQHRSPIDLVEWKTKFVQKSWDRQRESVGRPSRRHARAGRGTTSPIASNRVASGKPGGHAQLGESGSVSLAIGADREADLRESARSAREALEEGNMDRVQQLLDRMLADLAPAEAREG